VAASSIRISGFDDVNRQLKQLQKRLEGAFVKAVEAAVDVIESEVRARTPVGETEEGKRHLRDAIVHVIRVDPLFRFVAGSVGFGNEGYRALWVEYGHRMVSHKPKKAEIGTVPPHPFLRPAFDACKERAVEVFSSVLQSEIKTIYG